MHDLACCQEAPVLLSPADQDPNQACREEQARDGLKISSIVAGIALQTLTCKARWVCSSMLGSKPAFMPRDWLNMPPGAPPPVPHPANTNLSCLGVVATTCQPVAQFLNANLDPLRQTALSVMRVGLSSNDQHNAGLQGHPRAVTDQERSAAASGIRVRAITALRNFDCT